MQCLRAEFLRIHDRQHATVDALQAALDAWVEEYNTVRPHQALGMRPPIERFQLVQHISAVEVPVADPIPASEQPGVQLAMRCMGCSGGWIDAAASRLAGFSYRVPIILAGEPVEAVVADHLVRIFHRDVLVASMSSAANPIPKQRGRCRAAGPPTRRPGLTVTRVADNSGDNKRVGEDLGPLQLCVEKPRAVERRRRIDLPQQRAGWDCHCGRHLRGRLGNARGLPFGLLHAPFSGRRIATPETLDDVRQLVPEKSAAVRCLWLVGRGAEEDVRANRVGLRASVPR